MQEKCCYYLNSLSTIEIISEYQSPPPGFRFGLVVTVTCRSAFHNAGLLYRQMLDSRVCFYLYTLYSSSLIYLSIIFIGHLSIIIKLMIIERYF